MPPSHTGVGTTAVLADPGGAVFSVTKIDVPASRLTSTSVSPRRS